MQPQRRVGQRGLVPGEPVPGNLRATAGRATAATGGAAAAGVAAFHHPLLQPGQERGGGEARVEQAGAQLGEPDRLTVHVVGLGRRRRGEVGQLLVRGQVAVADQGRRRHFEVDRPEHLAVQCLLVGGHQVRRRRGQPDEVGVLEPGHDLPQQPPPDLQQVVALVQDQRPRALRGQPVQQGPPVRVQDVQQLPVRQPMVGGAVVDRAHGLVGEHGQRGGQFPVGGGPLVLRRPEHLLPLRHPLGLDRGVRAEHQRGPAQPPGRLQPDQRLAATGRDHQVRGGPARRHRPVEGGQRPLLVRPQLVPQLRARKHQVRLVRPHSAILGRRH